MTTIYEQMLEAVKYYEANQPLKKVTVTVYKDKKEQTELTTDAELLTAFKGGKSITDFEVTTEVVDPKKELTELIFGEEKPKAFQVAKFFQIVGELTGTTIIAAPEAKTEDLGKKAMKSYKQKVYNVAGGQAKDISLEQAIKEATEVYAKYGKVFTYNPKGKKTAPETKPAE